MGALRKFKINNEACTSFKIEKIKLPLTMPHARADLLPQMPHPGKDKVVKCPTNAAGGGGEGGGACVQLELSHYQQFWYTGVVLITKLDHYFTVSVNPKTFLGF